MKLDQTRSAFLKQVENFGGCKNRNLGVRKILWITSYNSINAAEGSCAEILNGIFQILEIGGKCLNDYLFINTSNRHGLREVCEGLKELRLGLQFAKHIENSAERK